MRIAMITHHWVPNFGANLQSLSTYSLLRKLGHDTTVLNFRPVSLEAHSKATVSVAQLTAHAEHCCSMLNQSPLLRNEDELVSFCQDGNFDLIIAGSDSIFRIKDSVKTEEGAFPNPFWLGWMRGLSTAKRPRSGFLAASCEGSYYFTLDSKTQKGITECLASVDHVTVRDRWTQKMIKYASKGKIDPVICPDPVSVLNDVCIYPCEDVIEPRSLKGKYILLCTSPKYLTPDWCKAFTKLAHARGLQVFTLPTPSHEVILPVDRVLPLPMSPIAWYEWIKNSAGMITVNFHPVACSIFNNVPFISLDISGPMYLRCLAIRPASKTYDLCMNIDGQNRSFLPLHARCLLTPGRAMNLLRSWDSTRATHYALNAKQDFKRIVETIIG